MALRRSEYPRGQKPSLARKRWLQKQARKISHQSRRIRRKVRTPWTWRNYR